MNRDKRSKSSLPSRPSWLFRRRLLCATSRIRNSPAGFRQPHNWRAFSFTFFLLLLISVLWEVTLAPPYGWWNFRSEAMIGLYVGAWPNLQIEEPCVWIAVTFTTVIVNEVIKIWKALGTGAFAAFFGCG